MSNIIIPGKQDNIFTYKMNVIHYKSILKSEMEKSYRQIYINRIKEYLLKFH